MAHNAMVQALLDEVFKRTADLKPLTRPSIDLVEFTREKVEPMVNGFFPQAERDAVLALLEKSVVFLTPEDLKDILLKCSWMHTAWNLANLYLLSLGAELLSDDAPRIVGLSEDTTCYVSLEYFNQDNPFADFLVHEVAHVFHNCKRVTAGLRETRTREWLLNIEFQERETFAYACEAYSRILELGENRRQREELLTELIEDEYHPSEDLINLELYITALRAAVGARNGWKKILQSCAPTRSLRAAVVSQ